MQQKSGAMVCFVSLGTCTGTGGCLRRECIRQIPRKVKIPSSFPGARLPLVWLKHSFEKDEMVTVVASTATEMCNGARHDMPLDERLL